jgi:hypothetical protein
LEGPAASEEASQHPVFFDTLEHRQQDPVRELFPKCLRGGQAPMRFVRRKPLDSTMDDRPTGAVHPSKEGRILVRYPEVRDGESPREDESQESQDADCAGETRWRTSQPAGG